MKIHIVRSVLILAYIIGLGLATMLVNHAPDHHAADSQILEHNAH